MVLRSGALHPNILSNKYNPSIIGPQSKRWSKSHLLKELNWLDITQIGVLASIKFTHKILNSNQPVALAHRMISKINHTRLTRNNGPFQLGSRPTGLGKTLITKYQYRPNAYENYNNLPLVIKQIKKPKFFKLRTKRYLKNNDDLPTNRSSVTPSQSSQ